MSEGAKDQPVSRLTRRRFLKVAAGVVLAGAGAVVAGSGSSRLVDLFPKPKELESAPDEIPREELRQKYGIRVIPAEGVFDIGFRQSAKATKLFQQLEARKKQNNESELTIVIVNGPYLSPEFLTSKQKEVLTAEEDRLASIYLGNETKDYSVEEFIQYITSPEEKEKYVALYRQRTEELEKRRQTISENEYQEQYQALEYIYSPLWQGFPEDYKNILKYFIGIAGIAIFPDKLHIQKPKSYVFVNMREEEPGRTIRVGDEDIPLLGLAEQNRVDNHMPGPEQSYPSPDRFVTLKLGKNEEFTPGSDRKYFTQSGNTIGTVLRHELIHIEGNKSEYSTDFNMFSDIRKAYENYQRGDDRGYWLVIKSRKGPDITKTPGPPSKKLA